jgi:glycolate oxidase FAD binding subunit
VEAGITLDEMQTHLAAGRVDAEHLVRGGASSIGGLIATNASGPRRLRYGTIRDLLIGVTVVLPDGTIAKSGGKVVKNVAGYDLGKLFTGSLGTLGVIVQATFRLHPRQAARRLVEVSVDAVDAAGAAVLRLMESTLVPTAVELDWPDEGDRRLLVLFEGIEQGVQAQAVTAATLLSAHGATRIVDDALESRWEAATSRPWAAGGLGLKVTYLPAQLPAVVHAIARAAARWGVRPNVRGSVANGVLYLGFPIQEPEVATGVVADLRGAVAEGSVVVQAGPARLRAELDVWGPVGSSLELMRRVKHQFDPGGVLNPGRFVGGI